MNKGRWLRRGIVIVSLAAALYTAAGAAGTMRVMDRADCQVMEECLRRLGHREIRVESGMVVMAGREVMAVLECVTPGGMAFTWKYPLAQMDNVTAGRVLGGLK